MITDNLKGRKFVPFWTLAIKSGLWNTARKYIKRTHHSIENPILLYVSTMITDNLKGRKFVPFWTLAIKSGLWNTARKYIKRTHHSIENPILHVIVTLLIPVS